MGQIADLMALDESSTGLIAVENDNWLDARIFSDEDRLIIDVWSYGQHLVQNGRHIHREHIDTRYRKTLSSPSALL